VILDSFVKNSRLGKKSLALLIDPDDLNEGGMMAIVNAAIENKVDYFLVGGSLITSNNLESVVDSIKAFSSIPCILFPGNAIQIHPEADAILFLSLISGRNPELLIGQHVVAAPVLKRSNLEIIPTGYMLIHSGRPTSVSYMSNTQPIPNDKPSLAISTAMAGEMLGLKCIYMDAGSGALDPVSVKVIKSVRRNIEIPLIVGGGLNSKRKAQEALEAGADMIVIGNGAQKNLSLLAEVSDVIQYLNEALNVN
jgi:putative glycerol-1-phosphate prenyltransferase